MHHRSKEQNLAEKQARGQAEGDRIVEELERYMTGGFDQETAADAVKNALEALSHQSRILNEEAKKLLDDQDRKVYLDKVSKAMGNTAKVIDEITRLISFSRGLPDSRPGSSNEWIKLLTNEQFDQVQRWVSENGGAKA